MADIPIPPTPMPPPPPPPSDGGGGRRRDRWLTPPPARTTRDRGQGYPLRLWLAKVTGLLPYGQVGLSPAAETRLSGAAVVLTALFIVDVLAWFGFWNLLLNGSLRAVEPLTPIAAILGLMFGWAIMNYEAGFLTTNLKVVTKRALWTAVTLRAGLIIGAAGLTALPVEVYLLEDQVRLRLHQEQVLAQIPALVDRWEQAQQTMVGTAATEAERKSKTVKEREDVAAIAGEEQQAVADHAAARSGVIAQRQHVWDLEGRLARAIQTSTPETQSNADRLRPLVTEARRVLLQRQSEEQTAATRLSTLRQRQAVATLSLKQREADVTAGQVRSASNEAELYEQWMHELWNAPPRQRIRQRNVADASALIYDGETIESRIKLGEQLIALRDLLGGIPPRRPRISSAQRQALKAMNLSAFIDDDEVATKRQQSEARALWEIVTGTFFAALFLPTMIFLTKILMKAETRDYFDIEYQRALGNPAVPPVAPPPPAALGV